VKKTTLRRELERDAIAVYDLDLVIFDNYDRNYSLVTVASLAHNWGPHNGNYRGRQISGPFKSIFDIPLYLPDDPKTGDLRDLTERESSLEAK
jgi:hypothetical protein